jgi:hypothetical protein
MTTKTSSFITTLLLIFILSFQANSQPKLYIQIVSHNEPSDNLNQPLNYARAKANVIQLANVVVNKNAKWNLQTSDGFVFGARADEINTGTNVFRTLAGAPYSSYIEIDPRNKNFTGRNIADQWYLLDSIGANPTKTIGGFIYYVCPPNSDSLIDWWQYTDTLTGLVYNNKVKFKILSGAGSLAPHCNDLNDFGIFKPDTTNNFYHHNPNRDLWCMGVGCAPVLDSLSDEQAIIDLIQAEVDSIQSGQWPSNKFYVTRIMTNQREYGPMFIQKISKVIDSLNAISSTKLKWATIEETFADFQQWQQSSGLDYSQWLCGEVVTNVLERKSPIAKVFPNPTNGFCTFSFNDNYKHSVSIWNSYGILLQELKINDGAILDLTEFCSGLYYIRVDENEKLLLIKN